MATLKSQYDTQLSSNSRVQDDMWQNALKEVQAAHKKQLEQTEAELRRVREANVILQSNHGALNCQRLLHKLTGVEPKIQADFSKSMNEFNEILTLVDKQLDEKHEENARLTNQLKKLLEAFDDVKEMKGSA